MKHCELLVSHIERTPGITKDNALLFLVSSVSERDLLLIEVEVLASVVSHLRALARARLPKLCDQVGFRASLIG
jgi:hypothetical protein